MTLTGMGAPINLAGRVASGVLAWSWSDRQSGKRSQRTGSVKDELLPGGDRQYATRNGLTDFSEAVVRDFDIRLFPVRRGRELLDALGQAAGGVVNMAMGIAGIGADLYSELNDFIKCSGMADVVCLVAYNHSHTLIIV